MRPSGLAVSLSFAALLAFSPLSVSTAAAQDCVRTVRAISDFTIRGDAWTWWNTAAGQYDRENHPAIGSVLVFKRTGHMRRGHVSLVSAVIDRRTIEVDHTWIDGDGLRRGMRVVDVSSRNDWSAVRVWHEPTDQLGMRVYTAYGFIMPEGEEEPSRGRVLDAGDRGMDSGFTVSPHGRGKQPRIVEASLANKAAKGHSVGVPGRKPQVLMAALQAPQKPERLDVAVLPVRKPTAIGGAAAAAAKGLVASVEGLRTLLPGRKPGSSTAVAQVADSDEH
ncbi:CHAP domain-containing protein [Azospirillum doebereinerae]|uniref:CHAP domain-containing protein n=1 Tax=Azospirillum doebereinerae TaxID=92933 RepID=UPI001EE5DB3C|nr:CHAP domain-containing protein [Azospirillum doebereinerae]MCG5239590.1 CHAP domain-containing protein [Azospirillum doebereinerae]